MNGVVQQESWPLGRAFLLVGLVALLGFVLAACSAPGPADKVANAGTAAPSAAATNTTTKTNEAGSVTLKATWPGPGAGLAFTVVMDTHSVDLDAVDLGRSAMLRLDQGREVAPTGWDAPKGGHHREGKLIFPDKGADGAPVIGPDTRVVELVIRDVAGVPERTLRWDLQS